MATTYIQSNFSGTGSSTGAKATYSVWVKNNVKDDRSTIISGRADGNNYMKFRFANDQLALYGNHSSSNNVAIETNRKFRDPNAWLHIVLQVDTTHATSTERVKIFVNGVQETSFANSTYPAQNAPLYLTKEDDVQVGAFNNTEHFDGCMSHFYCIDGTIYAPTVFAETDATDGMWKGKANPSVTYGSKGWLIFKNGANLSGSTVSDQSTNSNDWTVATGTLTPTKDSPDSNMSTLSPLAIFPSGLTMTNGNTSIASTASQWAGRFSTQRVFKGKYYVEAQFVTGHNLKFGVQGEDKAETENWTTLNTSYAGKSAVGYEFQCNNGNGYKVNNNSSPRWTNSDFTTATSTIMMAFDLDNGKIWWGRNGTWFNTSGTANPATGADAAFTGISTDKSPYLFGLSLEGNGSSSNINFGNGYYATTAIGSSVTANEGTWAYAPPTGFGAVNTKWINTF